MRAQADWTNARSADGTQLADYFDRMKDIAVAEGKADLVEQLTASNFARRLHDWRKGAVARFDTVDRWLCNFDVHPSELPDGVWYLETEKGGRGL